MELTRLALFLRQKILCLYFGMVNSFHFRDLRILFSCVITHRLPKTTCLPHPVGIVIGRPPGTRIGEHCTILQNVTIGVSKLGDHEGPKIGNNVIIWSGAVVTGNIRIGNNAVIGANAVVLSDVPEKALAVGVPAHIIYQKSRLTETLAGN